VTSRPSPPTPPDKRVAYPAVLLIETDPRNKAGLPGLSERNATGISAAAAIYQQEMEV